jgi:hypothetical protein
MTTSESPAARGAEISPHAAPDGKAPETAEITGTVAAPPPDASQLAEEIERTRELMGDTVQELVARVEATRRPLAKAGDLMRRARRKTVRTRNKVWEARDRWMPFAAAGGVLIAGFSAIALWSRRQA